MMLLTSSPYFQTPSNDAVNPENKKSYSSYFQKSPSSTYGSIRSLGPLIGTWTGCISSICQRLEDGISTCTSPKSHPDFPIDSNICLSCQPVIQSSMAHFQECPLFQERLKEIELALNISMSCTCQMEERMEHAVRHLCPYQCFLKAYSPNREWVFFRKELYERTDERIDDLLHSWTCRLVESSQSVATEGGDEGTHKEIVQQNQTGTKLCDGEELEGKPFGAITPQIELFCSKTQKSYSSRLEAMRALGLEAVRKKKRNQDDADWEMGRADDHKDDGHMEMSGDTAASAQELCLSRITPPAFGLMHKPIPPFSGQRRRLWKNNTAAGASLSSSMHHFSTGRSPLGLLEELFIGHPWELLVSAILLNRSRRAQVDYILWGVLKHWPTPQALLASTNAVTQNNTFTGNINDHDSLRKLVKSLGLQTRRSRGLVRFSKEYLSLLKEKRTKLKRISTPPNSERKAAEEIEINAHNDPAAFHLTRDEILGLYNCGDYVADAYQIFIANHAFNSTTKVDWNLLHPKDHALAAYVEWKRSAETSFEQDENQ